ncbi:MAG TPA: universal stress protein [Solirubrobacterales bacterium]|nr:universal stress protein [Solirubrobacterales bacterium]
MRKEHEMFSRHDNGMFKTIILALDGSDGAKQAIPVAAELAEKERAKIVIAHVTEYMAAKGGELPHAGEDEIRAEIDRQAKELSDRGIDTKVELADTVLGGPAPAIVEIADRNGGDLIVTGTRGHSSVAGIALGSVAQRLLHIAKRPTLAVPS